MREAKLLLILGAFGTLRAHEVPTHHAITFAAYQYLLDTLKGDQYKGFRACLPEIEYLLQEGTGEEDLAPGNRFMFHFAPRLHDKPSILGVRHEVEASCSSREWAFSQDFLLPNYSKVCVHSETH